MAVRPIAVAIGRVIDPPIAIVPKKLSIWNGAKWPRVVGTGLQFRRLVTPAKPVNSFSTACEIWTSPCAVPIASVSGTRFSVELTPLRPSDALPDLGPPEIDPGAPSRSSV